MIQEYFIMQMDSAFTAVLHLSYLQLHFKIARTLNGFESFQQFSFLNKKTQKADGSLCLSFLDIGIEHLTNKRF